MSSDWLARAIVAMIGNKRAMICSYGDVGEGCAADRTQEPAS